MAFKLTFLFLSSLVAVNAGNVTVDQPCDLGQNRLLQGNYQFYSDCVNSCYCHPDRKVCVKKNCTKDEFPFGFERDHFPPKCKRGQFCPDEMSECQDWIPVGQPCQMNRDDECEAPPNFRELRDETSRGLNFNGSVCLNGACMWANRTLDEECVVENTAFIGYEADGTEFINIVSRGNCKVGFYCDAPSKRCQANKALGDACKADKECESWNCQSNETCGKNLALPVQVGVWVYVVVGLGMLLGIIGTLYGLYTIHRKHRDQEREKRVQYWREQNAFHQNLLQMRETARASVHSLHGASKSDGGNSDESHAPILQNAAPKGSGLRYTADDSDDESFMHSQPQRVDGRF